MRIGGMRLLVFAVVGVVVVGASVAACGQPGGSVEDRERSLGNAAASPSGSPPAVTSPPPPPPPPPSASSPTAARAAFLTHAFTDVRDGKQFTLSDFPGKQVLVIGMAVW